MPRITPRPALPDEPLDRLSLLVADLTQYAEKGGMSEESAKLVYDALMSGLAGFDIDEQATLLDRLRAWTEPPKKLRHSRAT